MRLRLVWRQSKNVPNVASGMENPDDLQRLRFVPVDDQVRIDQEEAVPFAGQLLAPMADAGVFASLTIAR
jgi:hypothetical protein